MYKGDFNDDSAWGEVSTIKNEHQNTLKYLIRGKNNFVQSGRGCGGQHRMAGMNTKTNRAGIQKFTSEMEAGEHLNARLFAFCRVFLWGAKF